MGQTFAELVEGDTLLIAVSTDPRFINAKFKSTKLVTDLALEIARERVIDRMRSDLLDKLAEMYAKFEDINGERPDTQTDEWDEALDDQVSSALEPYAKLLSASWLGINTVDTRLHIPGEIQKLANSFAAQVWAQLTYQRTDTERLAAIGIAEADINALLGGPVVPKKEEPMTQVNAVLNKIMLAMPDDTTLEEDLDNASDTDDGLAMGAAQRLGISLSEAKALRAARAEEDGIIGEWMYSIQTGELLSVDDTQPKGPVIEERSSPPPPKPLPPIAKAPSVSEPLPIGAKGRKRVPANAAPPPHAIPQATLVKLKTFANIHDEDVATMFGVSRPTMNNYLRGKSHAVPTPVQRESLKAYVQRHITALTEVLDEIG